MLWATFVALVSFFSWANYSEIDQITRAPGSVIPSSNVQLIQSKDGGVLEKLPVGAGEIVEQGQIIAQFETTNAEADFQEAKAQVAALSAAMSRLTAELFGTVPQFTAATEGFSHFVSSQKLLFERRQSAKREEIANLNAILALVREEIQMNEPLLARVMSVKLKYFDCKERKLSLWLNEEKSIMSIFKVLRLNTMKPRKSLSESPSF